MPDEEKRFEFNEPAAAEAMLAALRKAQKITIAYTQEAKKPADERVLAEISLSGAAGAMLWMDEQQRRHQHRDGAGAPWCEARVERADPPALPVIRRASPGNAPAPKQFPRRLPRR